MQLYKTSNLLNFYSCCKLVFSFSRISSFSPFVGFLEFPCFSICSVHCLCRSNSPYKCVYMRCLSHRCQFKTGMTTWIRVTFTWWLPDFILFRGMDTLNWLDVYLLKLFKYSCGNLSMHYQFHSTDRRISYRKERLYVVQMKLSLRQRSWGELLPVRHVPVWHFLGYHI